MPDLTALSALREAATDYPRCSHYLDYSKCQNAVTMLCAVTDALIAELEAAREVVAAASRGCDKCLHDNDDDTPEECRDVWGCGFADTRRALANHKEATRHE